MEHLSVFLENIKKIIYSENYQLYILNDSCNSPNIGEEEIIEELLDLKKEHFIKTEISKNIGKEKVIYIFKKLAKTKTKNILIEICIDTKGYILCLKFFYI